MIRRLLLLTSFGALAGACASPPVTTSRVPVSRSNEVRRPVPYDSTAPLGDISNPIRGNGPFGEREYLSRLRCPGGAAPAFEREGNVGSGGDTHILDAYAVTCPNGGPVLTVFMDMYHADRERRPVGTLTVLPELPARMATGCPPQVGPTADSSARYVYNYLEVETPAEPLDLPNGPVPAGMAGYATVSFVIDTAGRAETASVQHGEYEDAKLQEAATRIVTGLHFRPAEHHAGCRVRQGMALELQLK